MFRQLTVILSGELVEVEVKRSIRFWWKIAEKFGKKCLGYTAGAFVAKRDIFRTVIPRFTALAGAIPRMSQVVDCRE